MKYHEIYHTYPGSASVCLRLDQIQYTKIALDHLCYDLDLVFASLQSSLLFKTNLADAPGAEPETPNEA